MRSRSDARVSNSCRRPADIRWISIARSPSSSITNSFPRRPMRSNRRPSSAASGGSNVFSALIPGASADSISAPATAAPMRRAVISTSGSSGMGDASRVAAAWSSAGTLAGAHARRARTRRHRAHVRRRGGQRARAAAGARTADRVPRRRRPRGAGGPVRDADRRRPLERHVRAVDRGGAAPPAARTAAAERPRRAARGAAAPRARGYRGAVARRCSRCARTRA